MEGEGRILGVLVWVWREVLLYSFDIWVETNSLENNADFLQHSCLYTQLKCFPLEITNHLSVHPSILKSASTDMEAKSSH